MLIVDTDSSVSIINKIKAESDTSMLIEKFFYQFIKEILRLARLRQVNAFSNVTTWFFLYSLKFSRRWSANRKKFKVEVRLRIEVFKLFKIILERNWVATLGDLIILASTSSGHNITREIVVVFKSFLIATFFNNMETVSTLNIIIFDITKTNLIQIEY